MLDLALAMRGRKPVDEVMAAAEEAAAALERAGSAEELCRARLLLWELYRKDWRYATAALEVLDLLLADEDLPGRAKLAEDGARLRSGEKSLSLYVVAADLYRAEGDKPGELRALRGAIQVGGPLELLERADAIDATPKEKSQLHLTAARALRHAGRPAEALARAQAATRRDNWLMCGLLLDLGRFGEAEALARESDEHIMLALALRGLGREDEAQAVIEEHGLDEEDLRDP